MSQPSPAALFAVFAASLSGLSGCDLPKDQRGTSKAIAASQEIHAAFAASEALEQEHAWLAALVEETGAKAIVVSGETHALIEALNQGEIDLLIGLPADTPFKKKLGRSRPYDPPDGSKRKRVWAVRPGENAWLYTVDRVLIRETSATGSYE
jgi:hypothetical protein